MIIFTNLLTILSTCRINGNPIPAISDVCVFHVPNKYVPSIPINNYTLHGFWFQHFESRNSSIKLSYSEFLNRKPKFNTNFLNSVNWKDELGCGQYREYVKHGYKSGYSFEYWLNKINSCNYKSAIYPHICVRNKNFNCLKYVSDKNIGMVGCKVGLPYKICT